jgi:hypothetical protein
MILNMLDGNTDEIIGQIEFPDGTPIEKFIETASGFENVYIEGYKPTPAEVIPE